MTLVEKVCVLGAGSTKYGKLADSIADITTQASVAAIESAGIDPKVKRRMIYARLKTVERRLIASGIQCKYRYLEVRGTGFVIYFAGVGPASNGESFSWLVLRYNPNNSPDSSVKTQGDIDYTDFHTHDISEIIKDGKQ